MGICVLINLGAPPEQINVIPVNTTVGAEIRIHTLGAIGEGMVELLVFLICREQLFSIPAFFLA